MLDLFTTLDNIYNLRNFQKLYREQNKTSDVARRPSHTRHFSYGNYYRKILKALQI